MREGIEKLEALGGDIPSLMMKRYKISRGWQTGLNGSRPVFPTIRIRRIITKVASGAALDRNRDRSQVGMLLNFAWTLRHHRGEMKVVTATLDQIPIGVTPV